MNLQSHQAVLLIGGIDPQGCSGLSVDIQTLQNYGLHGVPLVSCLTEQTSRSLSCTGAISAKKMRAQYQCCIADFEIMAIKIGLLPNLEIAKCVCEIIDQHDVPVVLDPVLSASSGGVSSNGQLVDFIREELVGRASIVTPNLPELTILANNDSESIAEMAASLTSNGTGACLVTGGHGNDNLSTDFFIDSATRFYCYQNKMDRSVRGTGCALTSSLAAHLAKGEDIRDAVVLAKAYVTRGIREARSLGPYLVLNHSNEPLQLEDIPRLCYREKDVGNRYMFPPCPDSLGIYPVVDSAEWVEKLVEAGIKTIQLRIKDSDPEQSVRQIQQATIACQPHGDIALFINDFWGEAMQASAYGVHLGQEDLHEANLDAIAEAGLRLGVSTHSFWELARALAVNPSYIALGPIYETQSKQMPFSPQGIERLRLWQDLLRSKYPLVAIGGIDQARARELKKTGVGSVAMISAITEADDYRVAVETFLSDWE